jgi:hypothetical protein
LLVLLTILGLLFASVGTAEAKKKRKKSKNTIASTLIVESAVGKDVAGTIESSKQACIGKRKITVTRNNTQIAATESDTEGQWFTVTNATVNEGDVLLAKAEEKSVKSKKKKLICGSDTDRFVVGKNGGRGDDGVDGGPGGGGGTTGVRTLIVTASGPGDVDSNPEGIENCENQTCSANYPTGTTVVLTAQPDPLHGATFTGCDAMSGNTCSVTMSSNRTVDVTFACTLGTDPVSVALCLVADLLS